MERIAKSKNAKSKRLPATAWTNRHSVIPQALQQPTEPSGYGVGPVAGQHADQRAVTTAPVASAGQWDRSNHSFYSTISAIPWLLAGALPLPALRLGAINDEVAPSPAFPVPFRSHNPSALPPNLAIIHSSCGHHSASPPSSHHPRHHHWHHSYRPDDCGHWRTVRISRPSIRPFRPQRQPLLTRLQGSPLSLSLTLDPSTTNLLLDGPARHRASGLPTPRPLAVAIGLHAGAVTTAPSRRHARPPWTPRITEPLAASGGGRREGP